MVLHHVAQRADAVVIGHAALQTDGFPHGDLNMINRPGIPERLEHDIAKAQRQQVLHRFLAQIMIDAENLLFGEQGANPVVHLLRRRQILAYGLFHRNARIGCDQTGVGKPLGRRGKQRRGRGQIDRQATLQPSIDTLRQCRKLIRLGGIHRLIADHGAEL